MSFKISPLPYFNELDTGFDFSYVWSSQLLTKKMFSEEIKGQNSNEMREVVAFSEIKSVTLGL